MHDTCPMCHRMPKAQGREFCSPECEFEWVQYDTYTDDAAERKVVTGVENAGGSGYVPPA